MDEMRWKDDGDIRIPIPHGWAKPSDIFPLKENQQDRGGTNWIEVRKSTLSFCTVPLQSKFPPHLWQPLSATVGRTRSGKDGHLSFPPVGQREGAI